jgi:hypothetical protein
MTLPTTATYNAQSVRVIRVFTARKCAAVSLTAVDWQGDTSAQPPWLHTGIMMIICRLRNRLITGSLPNSHNARAAEGLHVPSK